MNIRETLTLAAGYIIEGELDYVQPLLDRLGLERLDDGITATTRYAFATGRGTVIKVAEDEWKKCYNEDEVAAWNRCLDERLVAPIVDWHEDYKWIEMVECRRIGTGDHSLKEAYLEKLAESKYHITDIHTDNLGIHPTSNEIVCYDYPSLKVR